MLVRQWIHGFASVLGAFERCHTIFYVKVEPRILESLLLLFGEACTVGASAGLPWFFARGNLDTILRETLVSAVIFSLSGHFGRGFFGALQTLTTVSARGLGGAGVAGSFTPR